MCRQCARGGCAFYFRNRGTPTNRALGAPDPFGGAQTPPRQTQKALRRSRVISVPVYREALPSLTVLSRRSAGGLGASSAHANGQRRSGQFRAWGFGFGKFRV